MKELKEAAENPLAAPPPKVVDHVWKGLTKQEKSKMPKRESAAKLVWRISNKNKKKLPKAPGKGEPHVLTRLSKFFEDNKTKFVHYNNGSRAKNRIIIMTTEDNLRILQKYTTVQSEGTFGKPKKYRQVSA
mgnify:CR=1 FL=1